MKRIIYVLTACLFLILCGCENSADDIQQSKNTTAFSSEEGKAADGFIFETCDTYIKITGYNGNEHIVTIPETITDKPVKVIGENSFYQQTEINEIHLPAGIEVIESEAFYRCYALETVIIPKSVMQIGNDAFFRCSSLQRITVDDKNNQYCDINGVLFSKDKTELIAYPEGKQETQYAIPDSVTKISGNVFGYQTHLKEIAIPASVAEFPNYNIFAYPDEITLIVAPDSAAETYAKEQNIKYLTQYT